VRRVALFLALLAVVIGVLLATGVVEIHVALRPPGGVDARPFWREAGTDGALPPGLAVWIEVARAVTPAVVNISTTQRQTRDRLVEEFFRRFFEGPGAPPPAPRASLGSGAIVSPDGYVITNYHVVRQGGDIIVKLADQREFQARLVGGDARTDIALLKVEARNLPTIPFGDSDRLAVGAPVMAIGNPFGLDQTVTTGIVSAKERFIGTGPYDDFIQTDASINPGNSGGPLVDAHGALVGINTAIFSQTGGWMGIGFATPVNLAKEVLVQLRATGRVVRGWLGVAVAPVSPEVARQVRLDEARGAVVVEVVGGSPAARAGIEPGDVIVAFQGAPVPAPRELTRRVAGTPPGTEVRIEIVRAGDRRTVTATLGELPERETRR
jgi:serine protease Do